MHSPGSKVGGSYTAEAYLLPTREMFLQLGEQGADDGYHHADDDDTSQHARIVAEVGIVFHVIAHADAAADHFGAGEQYKA